MRNVFIIVCIVLLIATLFIGEFLQNVKSNKFDIYQVGEVILCEKSYGDIVFYTDHKERIRIGEDGIFYVDGKVVGKDQKIYSSFREWIINTKGHIKIK